MTCHLFFRQKINLLTSEHGNFLSFVPFFSPFQFFFGEERFFFFLGKGKIVNDSDNDELWVAVMFFAVRLGATTEGTLNLLGGVKAQLLLLLLVLNRSWLMITFTTLMMMMSSHGGRSRQLE